MTARTAPLAIVALVAIACLFAGFTLADARGAPDASATGPGTAAPASTGTAPKAEPGGDLLGQSIGQEIRVYMRRSDDLATPTADEGVVRMKMNVSYLTGTLAGTDRDTIALRRPDTGDQPVLWIPRSSIGYIVSEGGAKSLAMVTEEAYRKIAKAAEGKPTSAPAPSKP